MDQDLLPVAVRVAACMLEAPDVLFFSHAAFFFDRVLSPYDIRSVPLIVNAADVESAQDTARRTERLWHAVFTESFNLSPLNQFSLRQFILAPFVVLVIAPEQTDRAAEPQFVITQRRGENLAISAFKGFLQAAVDRMPPTENGVALSLGWLAEKTTKPASLIGSKPARLYYPPDTLAPYTPRPPEWSDYTI